MKLWNLVFLATAIIYSTNTFAASTIWDYSNGVAYDRTNDWAGFNALQGDIQHIDNGVAGGSFGLWGADSNTLTNYQGSYSHTFDGTIADISGYNYDRAFVTLTNGEIWDYSNGIAYNRTNDWAGFNALQGDIQHIDNGIAGGFGLWGADSNTLTNYQGSYSHTFDGTIADISGYGYSRAFVTLTNGEIWDYSNGVAYNRTNDWSGFNALPGDVRLIDDSLASSFGLWGADSNTLTNYQGTYSHTFDGTITNISSYNYDRTFVIVSTVPVPAAVWLFGSGLIGLVGFARRKKA